MKKKFLSLVIVVALISTLFTSSVFATTTSTSADDVQTQIQATAEYYAGEVLSTTESYTTDAEMCEAYYQLFLLAASDIDDNDDYSTLESDFIDAVVSNVNTNGVLYNSSDAETAELYCGVIMALTAIGEDPSDVDGVDLISLFNTFLDSYSGFSNVSNPYYYVNIMSVLNYYSDSINNSSTWISDVVSCIQSIYYSDGLTTDTTTYLSTDNIEDYIPTYATILSGYTEGTDWYTSYGYYIVTNSTLVSELAAAMDSSITTGEITVDDWNDLVYIASSTIEGSGFYYYGFSDDNDAKMIEGLSSVSSSDSTSADMVESCLTSLVDAIDENGQVDGYGYGANSDSTGLALAAVSLYGNTTNATTLYNGLISFLDESTDGFYYASYSTSPDATYATKDALEGMIQYYDMLTDCGSLFDLSTYESSASDSSDTDSDTDSSDSDSSSDSSSSESTDYSDPTTVDSDLITSADDLETTLEDALDSSDSSIEIYLDDSTTITTDELQSIADSGKDVTISVTNDDNELLYSWTFDGDDLSDITEDIDLTITFDSDLQDEITDLTDDADALYITFSYHGTLPGSVTITTYVGDTYEDGDVVYLYYYDEDTDEVLAVDSDGLTVTDGYVEFEITHCSTYFLSETDLDVSSDETTTSVQTGDSSLTAVYIAAIAASAISLVVVYNKREQTV